MADVIVALDLPTGREALRLVDRLPGLRWAKVGSVLFTAEGPDLVGALREREVQVFLDLKWHDIPATVSRAVQAAQRLDVQMVTIHAAGGSAMLRAAAQVAADGLALVAVTVLTSHARGDLEEILDRPVPDVEADVTRYAKMAIDAGCHGVVASPREVAGLRIALGPGPLLIVPGIRRGGDPAGDQQRTGDPRQAATDGATHLVVGRPIYEATDPEAAYSEIRELAKTA